MKKVLLIIISLILLIQPIATISAEVYQYDKLDRVKKVVYEDGREVNYTYDQNGNIKEIVTNEKQSPIATPGNKVDSGDSGDHGDSWNSGGTGQASEEDQEDKPSLTIMQKMQKAFIEELMRFLKIDLFDLHKNRNRMLIYLFEVLKKMG